MMRIAMPLRSKDHLYFINQDYIHFFNNDIIHPVVPNSYQDVLENNDLLLLTGGNDLNPAYSHLPTHQKEEYEELVIDQMDYDLFKLFYFAHKPIIGICRGFQEINTFLDGVLKQHIYDDSSFHNHSHFTHHPIHILNNSELSQYLPQNIIVNSSHHQSIKTISSSLKVTAYSDDGLIEAYEGERIIGLQWHVEKMNKKHQASIHSYITSYFNL